MECWLLEFRILNFEFFEQKYTEFLIVCNVVSNLESPYVTEMQDARLYARLYARL